jgi:DNA-binding LytR/AlgR family response regulator
MKRNEHLFQFTGQQISDAAKAEHDYHNDRLAFWKAEQDSAVAKAKEAGVEVREYDITGGKNVQVVLDPTLTNRLTDCANKINSHRSAADRFQIESAVYATQGGRTYELQPDDVLYFRLAGGPRDA